MTTKSNRASSSAGPLVQLQQQLQTACTQLWENYIDRSDALIDSGGAAWLPVACESGENPQATASCWNGTGPLNAAQLQAIRQECRQLACTNEFAINGHENRISYIVGSGHTYRVVPKPGCQSESSAESLAAAQQVLDDFLYDNLWHRRQVEIVRRRDRDGEVFLRFFTTADGRVKVRFVEPGQVWTPTKYAGNRAAALGIVTDRDDVETVEAYFVDGQPVAADEIQHRKAHVDSNVRRGLPLFYPVRKNLRRAETLLRNMSVVAEIQSAIALIRRHSSATRTGVQQFVAQQADAAAINPQTGQAVPQRRYGPGTILDAPSGIEYDFPAAGLDASNFVTVLQAELRAIASRLVMPEFMLTSDASNANYASTMVAEGPAIKMFTRLQAEQIADDLQVMWRVLTTAMAAGKLPRELEQSIEIQAAPPQLAVRDRLQEAQVYRLQYESGILSPQTWSQLSGLEYQQEQCNLRQHQTPTEASP